MFSIIIPLYNKAPYIEKAIKSIQGQTYGEFELIVVDDGSKDNSYRLSEVALGISGLDYQLLKQENSGVSTARNNGVKLAKYPYICFLDADDWWDNTFLEQMKALIEDYPNAGIYGTSYYIVKNEKKRIAPIGVPNDFEKGEINYCQVYSKTLCMPLWTGAVCMPKNIFEEEKGFKPQLKLGEDFDLWIRIAMKHPVVLLNKPLAYYNQDVEVANRAIGIDKFYEPEEHMIFTDYGDWMKNEDFRLLFEQLALYSLLRYYLHRINESETKHILRNVNWGNHQKKYYRYYNIYPRNILRHLFSMLNRLTNIKKQIRNAIR